VLDPQGSIGKAQKLILFNSLTIMLCIVIPTILLTIAFAWWFRASNTKATYRPGFVYSGQVELVVWAIPAMVVLFLGGIAWIGSHDLDPRQPLASGTPPLEVEVVSLDWKWLFIYPAQNVASVNELVMPTGTPVHFRLTSASVMNAFFVPQLGSMIYTMNGMETQLYLQADHSGTFEGMSAQFSGDGFPDMRFQARALNAQDFDAWVAKAHGANAPLDTAAYTELLEQGAVATPYTYSTVAPGMFDAIVRNTAPIASGVRIGDSSPTSPRQEH
jgi:cytochrome o ubiquinol oxidase subunit 2